MLYSLQAGQTAMHLFKVSMLLVCTNFVTQHTQSQHTLIGTIWGHKYTFCTIRGSVWNIGVLADPMCGSGTFLIEAALMATNTAPGLYRRRWPFQSWPDYDPSAWDSSVASARQAQRTWDGMLLGNDVHEGALKLAKR